MPVRRDLRALYPPDWPAISRRIRFERAGGRCEECGRPHGWSVYCLPGGRWYDAAAECWTSSKGAPVERPSAADMALVRVRWVVLTCAHLDHDPAHNEDDNLAALCGRCHLAHDLAHHLAQRWITYRLRSAGADLFAGSYTLAGYPHNK